MKKLILLIALSALLYSAPGHASGSRTGDMNQALRGKGKGGGSTAALAVGVYPEALEELAELKEMAEKVLAQLKILEEVEELAEAARTTTASTAAGRRTVAAIESQVAEEAAAKESRLAILVQATLDLAENVEVNPVQIAPEQVAKIKATGETIVKKLASKEKALEEEEVERAERAAIVARRARAARRERAEREAEREEWAANRKKEQKEKQL